jgi:beta-N-acetylhexosaminidase
LRAIPRQTAAALLLLCAAFAAAAAPDAASGASNPRVARTALRELDDDALAHRLFVVSVAGRRPHSVSDAQGAWNRAHYGVATPAEVVRRFQPGGVVLFANNVSTVAQVTRLSEGLQAIAAERGYQLLIMSDQEGGRVSRLPGPAAEGQPAAASFRSRVGPARRSAREVGTAMRRMGVLVDLAPVADVNTVGNKGVIGDRSFGSTADVVSPMVSAQVCGYHAGGVATTLKHWPGHGSTAVDSHQALPTLDLPVRRWKRVHVPPFRTGIAAGADLVMVGHLAYPAIDSSGVPATLSPTLTRQWLRESLGFTGVTITDSLGMKALAGFGDNPTIARKAFDAGADLLLMPPQPRAAAESIAEALRAGEIDRATVRASVARVAVLQDKLGLVPGNRTLSLC